MAEDTSKTGTGEGENKGALTVGELRSFITDTVKSIVGDIGKAEEKAHDAAGKHTEESLSRKSDIATQVQEEIAKLQRRQERQKRDESIDAKLADLEKKVEVQPIERSRVHRIMGWGE